MLRDSDHYIAWRGGEMGSNLMGGPFVNTDDRLWNRAGGPFVLTLFRNGAAVNYAVGDGDAEEFIQRVLRQSGEDAGSPKPPSGGGPGGAEVRIGTKRFLFRDADLMRQWLAELGEACGEPLSDAELYRYTHPAPTPPEGAVEVMKIVEQAVLPYRSPALPGPGPDNCRSELLVEEDLAVLSVFRDGMHLEYVLPPELLPEVNAAAREMLDHPGDGYHGDWDEDAWLKVRGREEEFDARPEDVLRLFEALVPRCGDPIPHEDRMDFYKVWPQAIRKRLASAWDCPLCGRKRNTGDHCQDCGAKKEDIPSGRAVSDPRPRAGAPWRCGACATAGNTGGFCAGCGRPGSSPPPSDSAVFGYRKGRRAAGVMRMIGMAGPVPAPAKQGKRRPASPGEWFCPQCGTPNGGKFCTECGTPKKGG